MDPAHVDDARLAEALIQGDEQGYFADKPIAIRTFRETLNGVGWSTAWRGAVGRTIAARTLALRQGLAAADQPSP